MAEMIDDVVVPTEWVSAHTLSGIQNGFALTVQNKGPFPILITTRETKPADGSGSGFRMGVDRVWASADGDVVWIRSENGASSACIQVGE